MEGMIKTIKECNAIGRARFETKESHGVGEIDRIQMPLKERKGIWYVRLGIEGIKGGGGQSDDNKKSVPHAFYP